MPPPTVARVACLPGNRRVSISKSGVARRSAHIFPPQPERKPPRKKANFFRFLRSGAAVKPTAFIEYGAPTEGKGDISVIYD